VSTPLLSAGPVAVVVKFNSPVALIVLAQPDLSNATCLDKAEERCSGPHHTLQAVMSAPVDFISSILEPNTMNGFD
jgi:hypothetical protein